MGEVGVIWRSAGKGSFKKEMPKRTVTPPLASQLLTTAWRTSPRNSNLLPWINHIMEPFITNTQTIFTKVIWDFQLSGYLSLLSYH